MVFGFGLLHGLGFAGVLRELGPAAFRFVTALFGFNVGVELGQLTVIGAAFVMVGFWCRDPTWMAPGRIARLDDDCLCRPLLDGEAELHCLTNLVNESRVSRGRNESLSFL